MKNKFKLINYCNWLFFSLSFLITIGCNKSVETQGTQALCPIVISTDPMHQSVDIVYDQVIRITFNTEMDSSSIENTSFFIQHIATNAILVGKIATTDDPAVYTFRPSIPLLSFTNYKVTVKKQVKNRFHISMLEDYTAVFTTIPTLTLLSSKNEDGIVHGAGNFAQNSKVAISAIPTVGFVFSNWTEKGMDKVISTSPNYLYLLNGSHTLIANFAPVLVGKYSISLSSNPAAGGTTSGSGAYETNARVDVLAMPNANFSFLNWTENGNIFSLYPGFAIANLNTNRTFVANFIANPLSQLTLTLSSNPIPGGTTTGGGTYVVGSSVTINANKQIGYNFVNWTDQYSGNIISTSAAYTFVLNTNKNLIANFSLIPTPTYSLNILSNNGTVHKNPSQASYTSGSIVTLTAEPIAGYQFSSWSGDTTTTTNPINIWMNKNKEVTANFIAIPATTYTIHTTGLNGVVQLSPNQPNYSSGSNVQLTATPNSGYTFTTWNGDTITTTNPLIVKMNSNKNINALFTIIPLVTYTLNTNAVNGTITKNPNQINYTTGSTVQLTATANAGYTFGTWAGDAAGSTNPITVNMTANKTISANFNAIPPPVALGSIENFGAYGGNAGITNQGVHTVVNNGAIGTTAAATLITGFHDGITGSTYTETPLNIGNVIDGIYTAPPAPGTAASFITATNALSDANTAYLSISPASKPGGTDPGDGELGGRTLAPGIYKSSIATFKITNQDLRLDAQGDPYAFWIFQSSAGLTVGSATAPRNVILIGGAQAKNVFWYVGSAAVINYAGGGTMVGTIIATAGVTLSSPANSTTTSAQTILNGRAISLVASVTMVNTIINNQ